MADPPPFLVTSSSEGMSQNKFLTKTLKPYMLSSRQIRLSRTFARENGIKKAGEITLVDKHGVKWPSYLASVNHQGDFYMTKGWISFCAANGLKIGETFTLEFVRGEDTTPMLKFCSKVKIEQSPFNGSRGTVQASWEEEETEIRVQKRARVYEEGETSRHAEASNKSRVDSRNLQQKQTLKPCSISDQVRKVKLNIVEALNGVRGFRLELEIKEKNLEALLHEFDASVERVLEMEKILKYHHV